MADLTKYFAKTTTKANDDENIAKQRKTTKRKTIKNSSDEEPIPVIQQSKKQSKKRSKTIISSSDDDFVNPPPKKSKSGFESMIYKKMKERQNELKEIDPSEYFSNKKTLSAPSAQTSKSSKRKKTNDDFIACDNESLLSDDETVSKHKIVKKKDVKEDEVKKLPGFLQALNREPSKFLGQLELPVGAKNCLSDLTFVITGVTEYFDRDDIVSLIKRYGGRNTTSISGRTTYLIVGREPGESKMAKAKSLGTLILSEEEFYHLISRTCVKCSDSVEIVESKPVKKVPAVTPISVKFDCEDTPSKYELWVDKYKPTCLSEVVGQQGPKSCANRLVRWLKDWDTNRSTKGQKNFFAGKENGSLFRAALLSGQPGVGKTTTAILACKELGYDIVQLNASDSRSKKVLDTILSVSLKNCRITARSTDKSVLIMDEVDGMSGNEDRGGVQELILFIKNTQLPIICICNDRMHPKIRSLSNYCFDLRFYKPRAEQIKTFIMGVCTNEGIDIEPQAAEQMVSSTHNDIRHVINNLQMWSATRKSFDYDTAKKDAKTSEGDVKENIFDVTRKLFMRTNHRFSLNDKSDLFFVDYSIIPLFVHETYLISISSNNKAQRLSNIAQSADLISLGSKCDQIIRSTNNWSLLPTMALLSTVLPTEVSSGTIGGQIAFPQWLGKNSTANKFNRMIQELSQHMQLKCHVTKKDLMLDYISYMETSFYTPLVEEDSEGVDEVIQRLIDYDLLKDDWDNIVELFQWSSYNMQPIPTKIKSAFTRKYNKSDRYLPYALSKVKKARVASTVGESDEEIEEGGEKDETLAKDDQMVRMISTPLAKPKPATKKRAPRKVKT